MENETEDERVYVTKDTDCSHAEVWPATVGIRKFHGCVQYGAAWSKNRCNGALYSDKPGFCERLTEAECQERYGFYPSIAGAWYIAENGKRTRVSLAFSA